MEAQKRSRSQESNKEADTSKRLKQTPRIICQYGTNCYRRSPSHFKEFKHPDLEALFLQVTTDRVPDFACLEIQDPFLDPDAVRSQLEILKEANILQIISDEDCTNSKGTIQNSGSHVLQTQTQERSTSVSDCSSPTTSHQGSVISPKSTPACSSNSKCEAKIRVDPSNVLDKWNRSSPFNYFLTKLPHEPNLTRSISFRELFHPSLGEVRAICHFNFMVEADWFLDETHNASLDGVDTTIVYGVETSELEAAAKIFPWLKIHLVKSPFPFGHHHTKMMLIEYTDFSMRFVVSTANLIESDWANRTQGLWVSPRCPKSSQNNPTDGPGRFRADLIQYLSTYTPRCTAAWIKSISTIDTSHIKVVFVGSAPNTSQSPTNGFQWGESKMEKILKSFPVPDEVDPSWPLVIQCSSIGTLGQSDDWVRGELGRCLMGKNYAPSTPIRIIYPSDGNVRSSLEGVNGGGCLPYSKSTHLKQLWIRKNLYLWKANSTERSRAMPHIKTYSRISPDQSRLGYFLLTSGNLSKAAWGKLNKNRDRLSVMSWEAGVLFLPHLFGYDEAFPISKGCERNGIEFFLPYDVPLQKYLQQDEPWHMDTLIEYRQNS